MPIKAVFFDIDGTLLNDRKNVQRSTRKAIQHLKQDNIFVGVATSRGPGFVEPFLDNLGLDFAICYNGQYIFTRDKILYQNQLPKSLIYRVIHYAGDKRRDISLGTASGLVGSRIIHMGTSKFGQVVSSVVPKRFVKTIERSFKHVVRRIKPQNYDTLKTIVREPIYQVVLIATAEDTDKIQAKFPSIKITRSSPYSADLIAKDQSKVRGISRIGELFDFSLQDVMAFGDSENDLEMLAGVGIGIAMGNADDKLKKRAQYVTANNNSDGIAKALAHYGLIAFENEKNFESQDDNFNKVKTFHYLMDGETIEVPRLYQSDEANHRANFKVEEIVEFLYATSAQDKEIFEESVSKLHEAIDTAVKKVTSKNHPETPLVGQVDALVDLLYLTYGSFVLTGIDPKPFFDIVHESNMGKIFPDGKAHFDPVTHKILKSDDWEEQYAPEKNIKVELNRQMQKALMKKKN